MKKVLWIVGAVVLVVLAAAGGFYAGMQYQTNKVNQVQANFERERGQFPGGQLPAGQAPSGGQFLAGQADGQFANRRGGISGQVKTIEGDVLTISTAEDVTTVNLSADTQIQKTEMVTLSASDLQPGMRVMIVGSKDSTGNVSATQVIVLNDMPANPPSPAATEKAP
jgi:hypothetical protein